MGTASGTDTPISPHASAPPPPGMPTGRPAGSSAPLQLGLRELCESREVLRFALCFSFQPQLVPGFIISKGDKAPDGRKLAGAQAAGPSALGASQQIVPWTARRSNQSILKEISPGCSLEE